MESGTNDLYRFLLQTDPRPWYIPKQTRRVLIRRAGFCCMVCKRVYRGRYDYMHIDHIQPIARGGKATLDNLQVLCRSCNLQKSDHIIAPESYSKGYVIPIYMESEQKIAGKILDKIADERK